MILELRRVNKAFGAIVVADDINLSVARGEAVGVIGPNGAGKSTLFNLVTGVLAADSGNVLLDGIDITAAPPERRCRDGIGRSFQVPRPFDGLTVYENLLVAAMFGGAKREREAAKSCGDILVRTGLEAKANRSASSLTLLDRKRLEMGRALATDPYLLLLDEIAGGLTEAECQVLVATIRKIHKSGVAIIWIEHIVHALLAVVSRLVVLNFGRVIAEGDPATVMQSAEVHAIYLGVPA